MTIHGKKVAYVAGSAVGIVLAVASVAWACTRFEGSITVQGNSVSPASTTQVAYGTSTFDMAWCDPVNAPNSAASDAAKSAAWTVRTASNAPSITVSVGGRASGICGGAESTLNPSTYAVKVNNGYMEQNPSVNDPAHNCHSVSEGTTLSTSFVVDADGEGGPVGYSLSGTSVAAGWNSVCVYDLSSADANALNFKNV